MGEIFLFRGKGYALAVGHEIAFDAVAFVGYREFSQFAIHSREHHHFERAILGQIVIFYLLTAILERVAAICVFKREKRGRKSLLLLPDDEKSAVGQTPYPSSPAHRLSAVDGITSAALIKYRRTAPFADDRNMFAVVYVVFCEKVKPFRLFVFPLFDGKRRTAAARRFFFEHAHSALDERVRAKQFLQDVLFQFVRYRRKDHSLMMRHESADRFSDV